MIQLQTIIKNVKIKFYRRKTVRQPEKTYQIFTSVMCIEESDHLQRSCCHVSANLPPKYTQNLRKYYKQREFECDLCQAVFCYKIRYFSSWNFSIALFLLLTWSLHLKIFPRFLWKYKESGSGPKKNFSHHSGGFFSAGWCFEWTLSGISGNAMLQILSS